jgi:predicted membrane chloride channel (bestrophin family)
VGDLRYSLTNKYKNADTSVDTKLVVQKLAPAVWAVPRSLQRHLLTKDEDELAFQNDVRKNLDPIIAEDLINAKHRPARAMYYLSRAVDSLPLCVEEKIAVDNSITVLADMIGTCERLLSSPVPLVYTR